MVLPLIVDFLRNQSTRWGPYSGLQDLHTIPPTPLPRLAPACYLSDLIPHNSFLLLSPFQPQWLLDSFFDHTRHAFALKPLRSLVALPGMLFTSSICWTYQGWLISFKSLFNIIFIRSAMTTLYSQFSLHSSFFLQCFSFVNLLCSLFIVCFLLLVCKINGGKDFCLFCSLIYLKCLKYLTNKYMNKWSFFSTSIRLGLNSDSSSINSIT